MPKKTNVEINGSNYFRVTSTIGKDSDGKPIRKQFYGSSKKEAETKRDEYLSNIKNGLSVDYDKALFGAVFKSWFENVLRPSVALSSYQRYETDYRLRIRDSELSNMRLIDIRATNIQIFYNDLMEKYSVSAVRCVHKIFSGFFSYCIKADLIIKNPLVAVEVPKDRKIQVDSGVLSRGDIKSLISASKDDSANFIFVFAVFTGLRQGELLALTHDDIDLESGLIRVNKSVGRFSVNSKYTTVLSTTKTQGSTRDVPILDELLPLLREYIRQEKLKCLRLGNSFSKENIFFSSVYGTYMDPSNLRKRLNRLYEKLGIEQKTFHVLRHTFCTILAEKGIPLKTASILMGHSDISVTAKVYTHVDTAEKRRGIDKLAEYFY